MRLRGVGTLLNMLALALLGCSSTRDFNALPYGAVILGLAGITFHLSQLHVSNLFPRSRGLISSLLVAGFTGCGILFYLLDLIFVAAGSTRCVLGPCSADSGEHAVCFWHVQVRVAAAASSAAFFRPALPAEASYSTCWTLFSGLPATLGASIASRCLPSASFHIYSCTALVLTAASCWTCWTTILWLPGSTRCVQSVHDATNI